MYTIEDLCVDDELGMASCSDDERLGVHEWLRLETRPSEMAADAIISEGPSTSLKIQIFVLTQRVLWAALPRCEYVVVGLSPEAARISDSSQVW